MAIYVKENRPDLGGYLIVEKGPKRKNEERVLHLTIEETVRRLRKYGNTVVSFNVYFSTMQFIWSAYINKRGTLFHCKNSGEVYERVKLCEEKFIEILKEETGFDVSITYHTVAKMRDDLTYLESPDSTRHCYFIIEKK